MNKELERLSKKLQSGIARAVCWIE